MQKRHATTVLLTATLAVVLAAAPLRHLAFAQAQQEGPPPHQSGVPVVGEALPPENPLPTLELTGYQAKAAMQAVEAFNAGAHELSPGVPTDLTRYRLRLIYQKFNDAFSGIFERDGVIVATPRILASGSDDPGIAIDGD